MTSRDLVPAIFLYTKRRDRIEGSTRFQKLVFLTQKEGDIPEFYEYEAEKYGPYSVDLARAIDDLIAEELVEKNIWENHYGREKHVYSLTTSGIQAVQSLLSEDRLSEVFDVSQEFKEKYNNVNLERLLRIVYNRYPDYATETELDTDRLFDPDANSEFSDPKTITEESPDIDLTDIEFGEYVESDRVFRNADDTWTARDDHYELTAQGKTPEEAVSELGRVIAAVQGEAGHEPTDEEISAMGADPEDARDDTVEEIPDFMQ